MNDLFDPTNEPSDADVTSALRTLPKPPAHNDDFWARLDEQLDSVAPATTAIRPNGRTQFLLVAAAILALVGVAGVAINDRASTVDVTDVPATVTTTTPTTVVETNAERQVSEIFRYDLELSDDFVIDLADERGVFASDVERSSNAFFAMSNYFLGDERTRGAFDPTDAETLIESTTVEVPLYDETDGVVTLSDRTLTAEQVTFDRGEFGQRVVRSFTFDDRTVVVELSIDDPELLSQSSDAILDGIRLYDQALRPVTTCSSDGLATLQAPTGLTQAAAERFDGIIAALISCDWALLEAQMDVGFMISFGGEVDAIANWQETERYGNPILRTLYDHLAFPVGDDDEGATWPRGWNTGQFDDQTEAALLTSEYYTEEDLAVWDEITYLGFRTGISDEGTWSYFVAGD